MLQKLHLLLVLLFHGVEVSLSLLQLVYQLLLEVDLWWGGGGEEEDKEEKRRGKGEDRGKKKIKKQGKGGKGREGARGGRRSKQEKDKKKEEEEEVHNQSCT